MSDTDYDNDEVVYAANHNTDANRIITELFACRIANGLSIADVAREAGIGRATVTDGENGKHVPSFVNVCKWANALGFTVTLSKHN